MAKLQITGPDGLVIFVTKTEESFAIYLGGSEERHDLTADMPAMDVKKVNDDSSLGYSFTVIEDN